MKQILLQLAQKIPVGDGSGEVNIPSGTTGDVLFGGILNIIYFLVGATAVIMLIVGGLMYVGSAGNQETAKKARSIIVSAVIGLVIVLLAFVITQFIIGRFSS